MFKPIMVTYIFLVNVISSIFISRNGIDDLVCGNTTHTCGTLYHASNTTSEEITVLDGQNEAILQNYINVANGFHPCLPQTFKHNITITFDTSIQNMFDWYPQICIDYDKNKTTNNTINNHMFNAIQSHITFNNLHIDLSDYTNGINFGLIDISSPTSYRKAHLTCNNCHFQNIHNNNNKNTMINVANNIAFNTVIFNNIYSVNDFIKMGWTNLNFKNVNVSNCFFDESFTFIGNHYWSDDINTITLDNCQFTNIYSQIGLFNEQWITTQLIIRNSHFMDIKNGYIYHAQYKYKTSVNIENIIISTSQLFDDTIDTDIQFLFHFNFADTVNIENITLQYNYNITKHCLDVVQTSDSHPRIYNTSYVFLQCHNPIPLIPNYISMNINNFVLGIDITQYESELVKIQQLYYKYNYITFGYLFHSTYAIIVNQGELYINHMIANGLSVGRRIFYNYDTLNIDYFKIIAHSNYTPNDLQSRLIITQSKSSSNIEVHNSQFIGGEYPISILGGTISIYDTTFQDSSGAVKAKYPETVLISGCSIQRVGRYYGNIYYADSDANDAGKSIQMFYIIVAQSVTVENNNISGYDDYSQGLFTYFRENTNQIIIRNNYFTVDPSNLLYAPATISIDPSRTRGLFWVQSNYKISIYGNNFYKNDINPQIPWILLIQNSESTCLSANSFSNHAIQAYKSNTTSCFRESLVNCITNECGHGEYGNLNKQLFNKMSHFYVDIEAGISSIYTTYKQMEPAIFNALDNIQIHVLKNSEIVENETFSLIISRTNILIMDSIIPSNVDILYPDNVNCSVMNNDRLVNNYSHVAKLLVLCDNAYDESKHNLTNISFVNYVNHLSAIQIHFDSPNLTYYPGQKLKFDYQIYDKLGNAIHENNYSFSG
eukprot:513994_1